VRLLAPVTIGARTAPNRILFGPHATNLGDGRAFSDRHVAYYERRARGGCGTIVVEEASVHESDWPYERAPLAEAAPPGWARIVEACRPHGALMIAAVGHAGGQGSSAYHQRPLWAPSRVPEVNTREVPKWMEAEDIEAVVDGFVASARLAVEAGSDGVEVNAGQHSLIRQFCSGLTNQRDDHWGTDRLLFGRMVMTEVRRAIGPDHVLGLRLSCDELAPWAGITPDDAPVVAAALAEHADYVTVVRGSIYSVEKTRPDFHEPAGFNVELTRRIRGVLPASVAVVLQGSVVDPTVAEQALDDGVADAVEMTRAQLADPDLAAKLAAGTPERVRPCILCNQACQVRDARNPIVSCVAEPTTGHETTDPDWTQPTPAPRRLLVVGGGPAGLEAARIAAGRGHDVRLVERSHRLGGAAALRGPGARLVDWQAAECERAGVDVVLGTDAEPALLDEADAVILATGSRAGRLEFEVEAGAVVVDPLDPAVLEHRLPSPAVVWDPIGGPIGVALAEELGAGTILVTPDPIAGNELARTGDLAPANVRLQQQLVQIVRRSVLRSVRKGEVEVEHRFSGERTVLPAAVVVDCGFRLPDEALDEETHHRHLRAGDCVAPRTILEAVLEGRRAAIEIDAYVPGRPVSA
jgi:2,4-dienoyl-CoA reductase (NADPH2)